MSQMGCFTGCGLLFRELEKALTKSRRVAGNRYFFLSFTANKPYDFMQPVILSTHLISSCIIYFYVLATQVTDQSHCKKNKLHDVKESPEFLNVSCGSPRFTRLCPNPSALFSHLQNTLTTGFIQTIQTSTRCHQMHHFNPILPNPILV